VRTPVLRRLLDAPSVWQWLDPLDVRLKQVVDAVLPSGRIADTLHGKDVGHPAHPPLAQAALSGLTGAALLGAAELVTGASAPSYGPGRRLLALVGIAGAAPTVVTGLADWSDLHEDQQRTGVVHAATMGAGLLLSVLARATGRRRRSAALDVAACSVVTFGAALGGHLAYRWAAGANHAEHFPHLVGEDWSRVCRSAEVGEGGLRGVTLGDEAVVVGRAEGQLFALADRCSHLAGPLHEGEVEVVAGVTCVVCPWHQSAFDVTDGEPRRGPAYAPQPVLDARETDGWVEVRPRRLPGVPSR
jgi:nitrite reductase/ring-hydroxylating ferredoxin subunit